MISAKTLIRPVLQRLDHTKNIGFFPGFCKLRCTVFLNGTLKVDI